MSFEERKKKLEYLTELSKLQEKYFETLYIYGKLLIRLNQKRRRNK